MLYEHFRSPNNFICLIVFILLISCENTPTSDSDIDGLNEDFSVWVDSSFYGLSATHNSHIDAEFSNNLLPYTPVFDLKLKLNAPSRRDEISKIIIYDDQQYGWEFTKNQLEGFFSVSDSMYYFENLLLKPTSEFNDKLFFVRVIGNDNQYSHDYNFIFKGDYPLFVYTTNYWKTSENLEIEYSINRSNSSGYNPLVNPDSITLVWLDANKEILSTTPQIKGQIRNNDFAREFYSYYETNSIPDNAAYSYSIFSKRKFNSKYRLVTSIDPIITRLQFATDFIDFDDYDHKIIYADNEIAIFITSDQQNSNQFSTLHIFNTNLEEKVTEITVFGRFYYENNLAHFDANQQNIYYFDENGKASFYNLETKLYSNIAITSTNIYNNYVLPFGDQIIFFTGISTYIYNADKDSGSNINFNFNFRDYSSYFYSNVTKALYLGDKEGENFVEITNPDSSNNFLGKENYRSNNLSSYSNSKSKLHYSSIDTSLVHTSGAVLSLKKTISFSSDSALTTLPTISGYASGWIDQENLLIVLDYQSSEKIRVFKKIGDSFIEYGYFEPFGSPVDIFIVDNTVKVSTIYYQGSNKPSVTLLVSYSLDDLILNSAEKRTPPLYIPMKKVSIY